MSAVRFRPWAPFRSQKGLPLTDRKAFFLFRVSPHHLQAAFSSKWNTCLFRKLDKQSDQRIQLGRCQQVGQGIYDFLLPGRFDTSQMKLDYVIQ